VITRNRLFAIIVLLAGLAAGYLASRVASRLHNETLSHLPVYYSKEDIPAASVANLSTIYVRSKEQFKAVLKQSQDAIREAARRKQVLQQSQDRVTTNYDSYEKLILQAEREVDLRRLLDYYSQFYLHYYRWLDMGDAQSAVQYKLALGQFKATLEYILEKQLDDPVLRAGEVEELRSAIGIAERSNKTIRWAKVVLVVLLFLLLMGIPRLIRDSGYKRFAASLYFDAMFRPNHISTLNRWHSIQRVASVLVLLYLFGLIICSSFISWRIPLIIGTLGLIPVIVLAGLSGVRGKFSALLISFMAPKMLLLIMVLGFVALRGPNYLLYLLWESEPGRTIFIALLFMLIFRKFHLNVILARKWSHRNRIGSAAMVCMALGFQLLVAGVLIYGFGPEESLASLNRELLLLPAYLLGPHPIFLNWMMLFAGILSISSISIFIFNKRRDYAPSGSI